MLLQQRRHSIPILIWQVCALLARSFGPGWGEVYKRPHAPGLRLRGRVSRVPLFFMYCSES